MSLHCELKLVPKVKPSGYDYKNDVKSIERVVAQGFG